MLRGMAATPVCLEIGTRRVFASALDWPGWVRAGRTDEAALAALAAAAPRYAVVTGEAGIRFPAGAARALDIVERLGGNASTDFGAPDAVASRERKPTTAKEAARAAALVAAAWRVFDRVVAGAPAQLRKGPRGGGRDRDAIVAHVLEAEAAYGRRIGLRHQAPDPADTAGVEAHRAAILDVLGAPSDGGPLGGDKGWPLRYAVRRIAWHVLDHAWEIEDRSEVPSPA
jgi:hypothetical protein